MPAAAIIPAVATIGAAVIGSNAAKHAGQQAAQQQQQLSNQSFQQQSQYVQQQQQALRNAVLGVMGQGNPYLNARSQVAPPSALGGGSFGGQQYGNGSASPLQQSASVAQMPGMDMIGQILQMVMPGLMQGMQGNQSGNIHVQPAPPGVKPPGLRSPLPPGRTGQPVQPLPGGGIVPRQIDVPPGVHPNIGGPGIA